MVKTEKGLTKTAGMLAHEAACKECGGEADWDSLTEEAKARWEKGPQHHAKHAKKGSDKE